MKRTNSFGIVLLLLAGTLNLLASGEDYIWPRKIEKGGATIIIYQPQVESLTANNLESRAAVSVKSEEYTSPVFGAMWFDCKISTDRDDRTVELLDVKVTAAKFPDIEEENILKLSALLEEEIPGWELELSLDQLLADLETEQVKLDLSEGLNNKAPEIIFTTTPAMLILVDGEPQFETIEKTSYQRVVNTPYFIVRDTKKGTYYIKGGAHWYTSDNFDRWEETEKVPGKLEKIADGALWEADAKEEDAEVEALEGEVAPAILLRTSAAELLQSNGEPQFEPIGGTSILFMSNTADDILLDIETQEYYILVSGRWYRSRSLTEGPWTYVDPGQVPQGFSDIPADSDMGSVRSSIAGTQEAREALLENQIPQTAEVDRNEARLEVSYDGKPQFDAVPNTRIRYAVNTDKSVLLIDNRYYCCDDAIWFESNSPSGPWIVSTEVPGSVQDIPPESPVYNVKYVYIYDYTPDVVYVGYTPGYVYSYAYRGCIYYGTGYYYRPWYGAYYYPRPVTYGYRVHWNPYTGWGFSFSYSWGWMTFGWGTPYRGWWGPVGYRPGYHYGYHYGYSRGYRAGYYAGVRASRPRPTPYASRPMPTSNVYNNRSQGVRRTGNNQYDPRTGNRVATTERGRPTTRPANTPNNVYTDRNGNVYRRDEGQWDRVNNGQGAANRDNRPSTTQRPSNENARPSTGQRPSNENARPSTGQRPSNENARPSTGQRPSNENARPVTPNTRPSTGNSNLNRDYNSRNQGAARSQQYQQSRPSYQQSRPTPSAAPSRSAPGRSAAPSRSAPGRSAAPSRRR